MIKLTGSKKDGWHIDQEVISNKKVIFTTYLRLTHEELLALKKSLQKVK